MVKPKGLGRGLDALLAGDNNAAASGDTLRTLNIEQLQPGKYQPRTLMDESALASRPALACSDAAKAGR